VRAENALLWTDRGWLERAHAWIRDQLGRLSRDLTGPIEQPHVRPWSTVLRAPTERGDVWFKANMPALAHEAAVLQVLARRRPDLLPTLLAADPVRGWMLQVDGGRRLREVLDERPDLARWEEVLPLYAQLQIDTALDLKDLLAAGTPDRRLAILPVLYAALLDDEEALRPDLPEALTEDEVRRLRQLTPHVEAMCDNLAAYGLPETIQHDDFHDGQVFVREGGYLFFDWGDACVAHPFFTLSVTLRVLAHKLGLEIGAPELDRFRDAYLEPWMAYRPRAELVAAFPTAYRLGGVCRALTWNLVVGHLPPPFDEEYADVVPDRLRMLLAGSR
jgi:hypothetical protein